MKRSIFWILLVLSFCGCTGLSFRTAPVDLGDPFTSLGIVSVSPNTEEQSGVLLRFLIPPGNVQNLTEETKIYAHVRGNTGSLLELIRKIKETYAPGTRPDSFILRSASWFRGLSGAILEESEMTQRGEILKLIKGEHNAKDGKFTITRWTRTPVLPEGPARIGDLWKYEEVMELRIAKQGSTSPYKMVASSRLTGFAKVRGRRCAVIETTADQIQTERLRVFFMDLTLYIRAKVQETAYLDYQSGTVAARIARIRSSVNSTDSRIDDQSISQTLSYPAA